MTRPTGVEPSTSRWLLGLASLIFLALAVYLSFARLERRVSPFQRRFPISAPFLRLQDLGVLAVLFVTSLLLPSFLDDGFVWIRVDAASATGVFSNIFGNNDAWLPQGFLHESILRFLVDNGLSILDLRMLISLVLILGSWVVLRIWVIEPMISSSPRVLWPAAAGFAASASAYLVTLRAEPWIVLCACVVWAALAAFIRRPSQAALLVGLAFGVLALVTHQSALVVLGPLAILAWLLSKSVRKGQLEIGRSLLSVLLAGILGLVVVALPFSVPTVLSSWQDYGFVAQDGGFFDEFQRLAEVFEQSSPPRLFVVLVFLAGLLSLFGWLLTVLDRDRQRPLLYAVLLSYAGLFLTSSKWEWHFGAITPALTVLLGLGLWAIWYSKRPGVSRFGSVLTIGLLLVCAMFSVSNSNGFFGAHDYGVLSWARFSEVVGPEGALPIWLVLFSLLVGLAVLSRRMPEKRTTAISSIVITGVLLIPLGLSMAWIAADVVRHDQWSLARQNLRQIRGEKDCGALFGAELFSGRPSAFELVEGAHSRAIGPTLQPGAIPRTADELGGPFPELNAWGSYGVGQPGILAPGGGGSPVRRHSPVFSLNGESRATFWTLSEMNYEGVTIEANFLSRGKSRVSSQALGLPVQASWTGYDPSVWLLREIQIPTGATGLFFTITIDSPLEGQWAAVSDPVKTITSPPEEVLDSERALLGPFERLHVPCVRPVFPENGYWPHITLQIREEATFGAPPLPDNTTKTSIGCSAWGRTCVERLWYDEAEIETDRLTSS